MHYYSHHVGDYHRDTAHLSILEHGVYRLLMDSYYSTERALPADVPILCRIVRAVSKAERDAVASVAKLFFIECDGVLKHNRIERELEAYNAKIQQASDAGRASAAKRQSVTNGQRPFNDRSTTVEIPLERNGNEQGNESSTIQEPVTSNQYPKAKKAKPAATDEEWLISLEADETYKGIPIRQELGKMQRWCQTNGKQASRPRFVNWLNRVEKPLTIKPSSQYPRGQSRCV